MDSFIYSINSTVPIFLVMILGWVIKQLGIIDDNFASKANKYVFKVALPVLLFRDLSATDFKSQFDAKFVIYCMVVTILMFSIIWILTEIFMKDESMKGAFVQASFRSSAAILGMAFIQSMYSSTGMAPLMIVAAVPLFNIFSVIVLTFKAVPENADGKAAEKDSASNIKKASLTSAYFLMLFHESITTLLVIMTSGLCSVIRCFASSLLLCGYVITSPSSFNLSSEISSPKVIESSISIFIVKTPFVCLYSSFINQIITFDVVFSRKMSFCRTDFIISSVHFHKLTGGFPF